MSDCTFGDYFEEDGVLDVGDDLFSMLESLEGQLISPLTTPRVVDDEDHGETMRFNGKEKRKKEEKEKNKKKRQKMVMVMEEEEEENKVSHIRVERNRRKQMNEHLSVLRSLMPCFYVKRGDQASIIGGVVDYINELQQILQSLESKKQRKVYNEILSPKFVSTSSQILISPRKPPLSPRLLSLPISPTTPTSTYNRQNYFHFSPTNNHSSHEPPSSSSSSTTSSHVDSINDQLVASLKSAIVDVEVKFCGCNLVLKTKSSRIPGQAVRIISVLDHLSMEILHVNISRQEDESVVNSFTIKIGIECQLSAEELAQQIQQTFCQNINV